jgi:tyrosine decarboxylase/aspartate 1-decarboxylase
LREAGLGQEEILSKLREMHSLDSKYSNGNVLCSMCTTPLDSAKFEHEIFLESNLGDPELFPGSVALEKESISILSKLLNGNKDNAGFIVSGGTEANLLAMAAARNKAETAKPEIIVSESSLHISHLTRFAGCSK